MEVTGAVVRKLDVLLDCRSECLLLQSCEEKPMVSVMTDIYKAAELCDFGKFKI